ncbi:hypothetical protein JW905_02455 [bacterium]|nr:hypothetical protein [candidate division CSSED10-310 bacterium]
MTILAYGTYRKEDLEQLIGGLLPAALDSCHAILVAEHRVRFTRHVPVASFAQWDEGILFGPLSQIHWRRGHGGTFRVQLIDDGADQAPAAAEFETIIDELQPGGESEASVLVGELRTGERLFWFAEESSRPLDYPLPGNGARVLLETGSYRLADSSRLMRFKGVKEC